VWLCPFFIYYFLFKGTSLFLEGSAFVGLKQSFFPFPRSNSDVPYFLLPGCRPRPPSFVCSVLPHFFMLRFEFPYPFLGGFGKVLGRLSGNCSPSSHSLEPPFRVFVSASTLFPVNHISEAVPHLLRSPPKVLNSPFSHPFPFRSERGSSGTSFPVRGPLLPLNAPFVCSFPGFHSPHRSTFSSPPPSGPEYFFPVGCGLTDKVFFFPIPSSRR